ncbi:MAG: hypothetical protein H8E62_05110 [Planctomycetes bacterium]|nr:hypothetical protein [Planctomycetota bacterium]
MPDNFSVVHFTQETATGKEISCTWATSVDQELLVTAFRRETFNSKTGKDNKYG